MGRLYQFECSKCCYRVTVAGGCASGLQLVVQTIHCFDCQELFDAITELRLPATPSNFTSCWKLKPSSFASGPSDEMPPKFATVINRLPDRDGTHFTKHRYKLACPHSKRHRVAAWKSPGKCPKCGAFLVGGGTPLQVWD